MKNEQGTPDVLRIAEAPQVFDEGTGGDHLERLRAGEVIEVVHIQPVAGDVEHLHALLLFEKMLEQVVEAQRAEIGAARQFRRAPP